MPANENFRELMLTSSHLSGGNIEYVEELYERYLADPASVSEEWERYFNDLPDRNENNTHQSEVALSLIEKQFKGLPRRGEALIVIEPAFAAQQVSISHETKQLSVLQLISSYQVRGHQQAKLDPLGLMHREEVLDLKLDFHHLSTADLNTTFKTQPLYVPASEATLADIITMLKRIYCNSIGYEYMGIVDLKEKQWIQQRIENNVGRPGFSNEGRLHILERLSAAEGLEKYLDSKYPGTKRFGLEGGESLIPALDNIIQRAGEYGAKEIVISMAHRGRLNVLVNTLGKNPADLFNEFEGKAFYNGSGDVKYHQGFSSNVMTPGGEVHCSLGFNPSHLEIGSPVIVGSVRARQDRRQDEIGETVLPLCIHGDAAFSGQGVVMETLQMSQTRGYGTGGTVHIVINNQIGFTTSRQDDARSTEYCTDVAKMVQAPIFHVNGDDPEAVLFVTQLALDFRNKFKKDVVVDLICYRRRGHNEADGPMATQPLMYKAIKKQPTTRTLYKKTLVDEGLLSQADADEMNDSYRTALDEGTHLVKSLVHAPNTALHVDWRPYLGHATDMKCDTTINLDKLKNLAYKLVEIPEGFKVNREVSKVLESRTSMAKGNQPFDWGGAELLAYASLVDRNYKVRFTGQDVERGTFSHRHAVLHDQETGETYVPLSYISESQRKFAIFDSLLSEEAVLAFEYGYATTRPDALVVWEAQFGDFANGAQVVIDQFVSSGEIKWERLCGLTIFLPHGYEGQGPEHSSARLERFLQLCAEGNIQVCVPTNPAQIFHMLRRQMMRPLRKPLVVMTPKSLLRHKEAISNYEDLANGRFHRVLRETDDLDPNEIKRAVLCSGKVYYELRSRRRKEGLEDVAILRLEQLYPFPEATLKKMLTPYKKLSEVVWCQEEPQNMGAWYPSQHHMKNALRRLNPELVLGYVGRALSASPAAGYPVLHAKQQEKLVLDALGLNEE